jgi:hypothetical protein
VLMLVISNENSVLQISISLLRIRLIFICSLIVLNIQLIKFVTLQFLKISS